jgi:hypothetical protein
MLFWIVLTALLANRHDPLEATDRLVPSSWKGNPWGPAAEAARAEGELPAIPFTSGMKHWQEWGRANLKNGDILFRRGDARLLFGYFPMSRFLANCSNSPFSHTGIVSFEEGEAFVYDMTKAGCRKQPLSVWVLDNVGPFGVKRPKPSKQSCASSSVDFCRSIYERQPPFDYDLGLDDKAFYCMELTEKAYRSAGMKLSDPIRLGDMDRAPEFPICIFTFSVLTPLTLEQEAFFPGNEHNGIWSCRDLETVCPPEISYNPPKMPEHRQTQAATGG